MTYDNANKIISIPPLSLEQARFLAFHYDEGRKSNDRFVPWKKAIETCEARYNSGFWDAGTKLRDHFDPPLLWFEAGKPKNDTHRIDECFFRNPEPLFAAIREAEKRAGIPEKQWTPTPDVEGSVGVPMAHARAGAAPAAAFRVGDIIKNPDGKGLVRICDGPEGVYMEPVAVKRAATTPDTEDPTPSTRQRARGARKDATGKDADTTPQGGTDAKPRGGKNTRKSSSRKKVTTGHEV